MVLWSRYFFANLKFEQRKICAGGTTFMRLGSVRLALIPAMAPAFLATLLTACSRSSNLESHLFERRLTCLNLSNAYEAENKNGFFHHTVEEVEYSPKTQSCYLIDEGAGESGTTGIYALYDLTSKKLLRSEMFGTLDEGITADKRTKEALAKAMIGKEISPN